MKASATTLSLPFCSSTTALYTVGLLLLLATGLFVSAAEDVEEDVNSWSTLGGPTGKFHYNGLPDKLLEEPEVLWEKPVRGKTYAPISADSKLVIVPDHDGGSDYFQAYDPKTGEELWVHEIENGKDMDFGASPRAMPLLLDDRVIVYNAWGIAQALDRKDGSVMWEVDTVDVFDARVPVWGYCSTPRIIEKGILFNPGGDKGGLVCLDPKTGETVWTAESSQANYAAIFTGEVQGKPQVMFYDDEALRSVNPDTGESIWNLEVYASSGYICPEPVVTEENDLLLVDQDNGTRLYAMENGLIGELKTESWDIYSELNTPILHKGKAYFFYYEMIAAQTSDLEITYRNSEHGPFASSAFVYTFLDPEADRMLLYSGDGSLTLMDISGEEPNILQTLKITSDSENCPALIGNILYVRDDSESMYAYRLW